MTERGRQATLQEANLQYLIEEVERRARREGPSADQRPDRPAPRLRPAPADPADKR